MTLHKACIDKADADKETILWYKEKFKDLLAKNLSPWNGNDELYQFQAVILQDIKDLPDKFTAYYCWDYDDENPGGPTIALFDVDAIDKVVPTVLSYDDMKNLIAEVKDNKIDLKNLRQILDFIKACTGKDA